MAYEVRKIKDENDTILRWNITLLYVPWIRACDGKHLEMKTQGYNGIVENNVYLHNLVDKQSHFCCF